MANYFIGGITYIPVDIPSSRGGYRKSNGKNEVKLYMKAHKDTGKLMAVQTIVSAPLIEQAKWKDGTKVRLMKASSNGRMLVLKPEKSAMADQLVKKSKGKAATTNTAYRVGGVDLARVIHQLGQAEIFEAWVEGDAICFKPKDMEE